MSLSGASVPKVTASNDPNELLSPPYGYTSKVSVSVPEEPCKTVENVCGVQIEVVENEDGAKSRRSYIQVILKNAPVLGRSTTR